MNKNRIEAFSDGVLAIIITIMILEIKVPHESTFESLLPLIPVFLSYILSFVFIGIYWSNHHHMFQVTKKINGGVLWANLLLLFWLSLIPFATNWIGEQYFAAVPMSVYGFILLMSGVSYLFLQNKLIKLHEKNSQLEQAINDDKKGKKTFLINLFAIPLTFVSPWISGIMYVIIALMWIVPDKRIENQINKT